MGLREESKKNFGKRSEIINSDEIQSGCLQRIADATELMASKYIQMEKDLLWYQKRYGEHGDQINQLKKQNASLRGIITRLKNKALKQF